MTDDYILYVAACEREKANLHLQWIIDYWKVEVGMAEIVNEDVPLSRTLRRPKKGKREAGPGPARFVPIGEGRGILVRDVIDE